MTENGKVKKVELDYVAPIVNEFDNENFLVTNIDLGKENTRFSIAIKRVKVDKCDSIEELNRYLIEAWGEETDLQSMIDNGLKQLSTRPNFKGAAETAIEAGDWAEAHRLAQGAMTDYRPGRRVTGGIGQKATIAKAKALESEVKDLGMNMDEMLAKIKLLKEQGLI